jgi:hypothetical protein
MLILTATLFNLLIEYAGRGVHNLVEMPWLLPILFILYFSLFTMLGDLIVRFRLRDYHIPVVAFFYGTIYEFFISGAALYDPGFLGVNWGTLVLTNLIFWASLQGILTFYFATRLFPRGPHVSFLNERGWTLALVLNIIALVLIHVTENLPSLKIVQVLVLLGILVITTFIFNGQIKKMSWRSAYVPFRKSTILDLVCLVTVIIFIGIAFDPYLAAYTMMAWNISGIWASAVAVILLVYRLITREPVPI